jgi:amidase
MKVGEYEGMDALALAALVKRGETTAAELVELAIGRIEALNPKLNAVIWKGYEQARATAAGPLPDGPFRGVPYLLKDLAVAWQGVPVTNTCAYLKDFVAQGDMEYAARIKRAGFVLVGKTNSPENGWSLSTEPKLFGPTLNPWKAGITAGGSSGGSAVAVATRIVPLADASDGAGSIRVPASNNGLVGLKPSRGRVTLGPDLVDFWCGGGVFLCVSRSVRDTAAYLDAVAGGLPGEPYPHAAPARPFLEEAGREPGCLKIAFTTRATDGGAVHDEVQAGVRATAKLLAELGHDVVERDFAFDFNAMWKDYTRMAAVQTAMFFGWFAGPVGRPVTAADVEPTTWAIIERGRSVSGVQHSADVEAVRGWSRRIATECAPFDAWLTPVQPQPYRPLGHWDMSEPDIDRYNANMGVDCAFTAPFNVSGQPAIAVPLHMSRDGAPFGVQLVGRYSGEATLIALAGQLERARPWADRRPPA